MDNSQHLAEENTLAEELESLYQHVSEEESDVLDDSGRRHEMSGEPPSPPDEQTPRLRDNLFTKRSGNRILIFSLAILAVLILAGLTWHHIFPGDTKTDSILRRAAPATYRAPITAAPPDGAAFLSERDLGRPARVTDDISPETTVIPAAEPVADNPEEKAAPSPEPPVGFTIQVASFPTEAEAKQRAALFLEDGMDVSVERAVLETGSVWYRTIIGRFATREEADAYLEKIRARRACDDCYTRTLPAS